MKINVCSFFQRLPAAVLLKFRRWPGRIRRHLRLATVRFAKTAKMMKRSDSESARAVRWSDFKSIRAVSRSDSGSILMIVYKMQTEFYSNCIAKLSNFFEVSIHIILSCFWFHKISWSIIDFFCKRNSIQTVSKSYQTFSKYQYILFSVFFGFTKNNELS